MKNETFDILTETVSRDRIITVENIGGFDTEEYYKKAKEEFEEIQEELHEDQLKRINRYIKMIEELNKDKMVEMYKMGFNDCSEMLKALDLL